MYLMQNVSASGIQGGGVKLKRFWCKRLVLLVLKLFVAKCLVQKLLFVAF